MCVWGGGGVLSTRHDSPLSVDKILSTRHDPTLSVATGGGGGWYCPPDMTRLCQWIKVARGVGGSTVHQT